MSQLPYTLPRTLPGDDAARVVADSIASGTLAPIGDLTARSLALLLAQYRPDPIVT